MTDTERRLGRFGAAAPGARLERPPLDPIFSADSAGAPLKPVRLVTTTVWDAQDGSSASGTTQASVVVPAYLAVRLGQYAAQSQVALIQTGPSSKTGPSAGGSS